LMESINIEGLSKAKPSVLMQLFLKVAWDSARVYL